MLLILSAVACSDRTTTPETELPVGKGQLNVTATGLPDGADPRLAIQDADDPNASPSSFTSGALLDAGTYRLLASGVTDPSAASALRTQDVNITVYLPEAGRIEVEVTEGEVVNLTINYMATSVPNEAVAFPDPNFKEAVRQSLDLERETITKADMATLNHIDATKFAPDTYSLEGIQHATNLEILYLGGTNVSDLSPLRTLTALKELYLWKYDGEQQVTDISPLTSLVNLEVLSLRGNDVQDFSFLRGLTKMRRLNLNSQARRELRDISFVEGMRNLEALSIRINAVEDLTPLADLTELQHLDLTRNNYSDLSPLSNLTKLETLDLCCTRFNDIAPLRTLVNLRTLELQENLITDISPLDELAALERVEITNNCLYPFSERPSKSVIDRLVTRGVTVVNEEQWPRHCD